MIRQSLLSTTALVMLGLLSSVNFAAAADLDAVPAPALVLPAVSGFNGKLEGGGGDLFKKGGGYGMGSFSVPLGQRFGLQVDGAAGVRGGDGFAGGAAHLFWRDPSKGLIGLYGSYSYANSVRSTIIDPNIPLVTIRRGLGIGRGALEAEVYFNSISLEGLAGVEGGNVKTRFFDMADIAFYATDNFRLSLGHRYTLGRHAAAFGAEYQIMPGNGISLFAEARAGERNFQAVWGGLRIYFGAEKSLIRRHREDDPRARLPDDLFALGNGGKKTNVPMNWTCSEGAVFVPGEGCQFSVESDRRIKNDLNRLGTLPNGLGLYSFRYLWSDVEYVGVMAQEVVEIQPEAVELAGDGFYRVNYGMLGLRMMTLAQWRRWPQWLHASDEMRLAA